MPITPVVLLWFSPPPSWFRRFYRLRFSCCILRRFCLRILNSRVYVASALDRVLYFLSPLYMQFGVMEAAFVSISVSVRDSSSLPSADDREDRLSSRRACRIDKRRWRSSRVGWEALLTSTGLGWQGMVNSTSLNNGLGRSEEYLFPRPWRQFTSRILLPSILYSGILSSMIEMGQYVCCRFSDSVAVSSNGTHFACPDFRQCNRTSNTPSESNIAGS